MRSIYDKEDLRLQLFALYLLFVVPIFLSALFFYAWASERLREDIVAADLSMGKRFSCRTCHNRLMSGKIIRLLSKADGQKLGSAIILMARSFIMYESPLIKVHTATQPLAIKMMALPKPSPLEPAKNMN